jgi:hypothetical protein
MAEVSRLDAAGLYSLYDVTSSSLNLPFPAKEASANALRVGAAYLKENFGELEIDWDSPVPRVTARIMSVEGSEALRREIPFSSLSVRQ